MPADPWRDLAPIHVAYTVMADTGGVYAWMRYPDEPAEALGRFCGDREQGWFGEHAVSAELEAAFAAWQRTFEHAPGGAAVDWPALHARGVQLAQRLKQEVKLQARVIYEKSVADPRHRDAGRLEVSIDGALARLPNRAQIRHLPLSQLVRCIVSGGQTGVDRAALDWAIDNGVDHRGWCPRGRRAEDGPIHPRYALTETGSANYAERTRRNVRESDATLVLNLRELDGGSLLARKVAQAAGKPCLVARLDTPDREAECRRILDWLGSDAYLALNVAGPRESRRPGAYLRALAMLVRLDRATVDGAAPA
jgi:hypothetical protein